MKKCNLLLPASIAIALVSGTAMAGESNHVIGGNFVMGNVDERLGGQPEEDDGYSSFDVYYRYLFDSHFGLELGYMNAGSVGMGSRNDNSVYQRSEGIRIAGVGQYSLSQRNSLYAKAGLAHFNVDYNSIIGESGEQSTTGFYSAAGWQYRFDFGLGLNVEYQYIPVDDFKVRGVAIGASYRF
ncbi:porin family protein [Motilimonas cestriensis]|uniref:porin family protein n=1 Tax=Motilimonas cestriensis TaxID=2742685 RepID=UPI003DA31EEE